MQAKKTCLQFIILPDLSCFQHFFTLNKVVCVCVCGVNNASFFILCKLKLLLTIQRYDSKTVANMLFQKIRYQKNYQIFENKKGPRHYCAFTGNSTSWTRWRATEHLPTNESLTLNKINYNIHTKSICASPKIHYVHEQNTRTKFPT